MSDMVVVYESGSSSSVEDLMDALREEGFHPALADDAGRAYYRMDDKSPGIAGMSQGRMKVRIIVPQEEGAAARSFLLKRDEQSGTRVARLTGGLHRPMALSALATAAAFIIIAPWSQTDSEEFINCLGIVLIYVLPVSFILTANSLLINNKTGQICALIITIAAVAGGMYCFDKALIYTGCFLQSLPIVGIAYIFFRTHKFVRSHKEDNSS